MQSHQLETLYKNFCPWLKADIESDTYQSYFQTDTHTLVAYSPNLFVLAKRAGVSVDYLPCGQETDSFMNIVSPAGDKYDAIIADLDTDTHKHHGSNRNDPDYMCHLRDLMNQLNRDGVLKVKMPLRAVKLLTERNRKGVPYYLRWNITQLVMQTKYVYVTIVNQPQESHTEVVWTSGEIKSLDIHNCFIMSEFISDYYEVIDNKQTYTTFDNYYFDHRSKQSGYDGVNVVSAGDNYEHICSDIDLNQIVFCPRGTWNPQPLSECLNNTMSGEAYVVPDDMTIDEVVSVLTSQKVRNMVKSMGLNGMHIHHRHMMFSSEFVRLFHED